VRPAGAARFQRADRGLPSYDGEGASLVEHSGRMLVPTDLGLAAGAANRWRVAGEGQGLPADSGTCIFRGREGAGWVGFGGSGLGRWIGYDEWETWTRAEGLRNDHVRSVFQDEAGITWAGANSGLYSLKPGDRSWKEHPRLRNSRVVAIGRGPD